MKRTSILTGNAFLDTLLGPRRSARDCVHGCQSIAWGEQMVEKMENDMSAKERLQALEAALKGRGVVDVKFCFNTTNNGALSTITNDVADAVEDVLADRADEFAGLGDSSIAA